MANFAKYTAAQLERLINDVYSGIVTVHNLPADLYNATLGSLTDAVKRGFGGSFESLADGSPDKLLAKYYANNIGVFSGAKTFQQVNDMSNLVFESTGFKRDFSDFKRLIKGDKFHQGIFNKYNDQYLRTEYDTAFRTAQMGKQWNQYIEDADALPYLKYITVHDERVRHDHASFDGITLPIGHKFWNTHTPPNGFNCRCRLIQLSADDNPIMTDPEVIKGIPNPDSPLFAFNPGKHGVIFDDKKHPYSVKINERFSTAQKGNFGMPTPPKPKQPLPRPKLPSKAAKEMKKTISANEIIERERWAFEDSNNIIDANSKNDKVWIESLSDDNSRVLKNYTSSGYKDYNDRARFNRDFGTIQRNKDMDENIEDLSRILNGARKYKGNSYRGISFDDDTPNFSKYKDLKKGDVMTDKGFASSSRSFKKAEVFTGDYENNIIFKIKSKNGVSIEKISTRENELEILFNAKAIFSVDKITKTDKFDFINLIEL